jgi:integrase
MNITLHFEGSPYLHNSTIRNRAMIYLEPAEVLSLLRVAKASGPRSWAMILVAYKHALRASEVCNLRVEDIDLKNGSIVVERLKGSLRTTQSFRVSDRRRPDRSDVAVSLGMA